MLCGGAGCLTARPPELTRVFGATSLLFILVITSKPNAVHVCVSLSLSLSLCVHVCLCISAGEASCLV